MPPILSFVLTPPNILRFADRETAVGATVYVGLRALTQAGGRMTWGEFCAAVWHTDAVAKRTVWSLCHRINEKLGEVGHPARGGTDAGDVVLC